MNKIDSIFLSDHSGSSQEHYSKDEQYVIMNTYGVVAVGKSTWSEKLLSSLREVEQKTLSQVNEEVKTPKLSLNANNRIIRDKKNTRATKSSS
jgi:hypothetical protein